MQLTISQLTAAGLTFKSWEDDRHIMALCLDADSSRRPGKAVYVIHQVDTGKLSESNTVQALYTERYVEGVGYPKTLTPPTFAAGVLVGWYWDMLPESAKNRVFNWNQVAAIEGGAVATANAPLQIREAAEKEITALEATYSRGGAVPYENIVIYSMTTLLGQIFARKAFYNQMALQYGVVLFPEAQGAHVGGALNFPPPDGTIQLGTGEAPIGVELNSATTPTRTEGPWPIGAHSAYIAPANAWRAGKPAPPPFRFPNPKLYYGPSGNFTGLDPQSGTQSTVDPTRDQGTEGPPPAPVTPKPGPPPATGTNVPAPSPDDSLSLPVGQQDPGGVTVAVDTATFAPTDSGPGNQSTVNQVPTGVVPGAGAVVQDKTGALVAKWGPWIAGALVLFFVMKRKRN